MRTRLKLSLSLIILLSLNVSVTKLFADESVEKSNNSAPAKTISGKSENKYKDLDEALAEVKAQRREIDRLQRRVTKSEGLRKEVLESRLDKAWLNLLKLGLKFANKVSDKKEKDALKKEFQKKAVKILESQSYITSTVIGRIDNRIKIPESDLTAAEQAVQYNKIYELMADLDEANQLLIDSLAVSKKFGLDMSQQEKALKDYLDNRAADISIFLELTQTELAGINAGLSAIPGDAELLAKQNIVQSRINKIAATLGEVLNMMDSLKLETTYYRQQILAATGEITTEVADVSVMTSLLINWSKKLTNAIVEEGPNLIFKFLLFIFILYIFRKLSQLVQRMLTKALNRSQLKSSELLRNMAVSISGNFIFLLGILIALSQLGISLGPLLAGLGVVGFVIGFALQDSLSNFASGMMILIYRPFDVGDLVETGGVFGTVHDMSLVNTTIMTLDNQTIVVPNTKIWGDVIKNVTAQKNRRIDMVFGVSYTDDIEKTEQVLADIVAGNDKVLTDPEPVIHLHELADSSVNFVVRPWVNRDDYWDVYWDITRSVKMRFDQEGISIPFPQRDVHLYNTTS